MYINNCTRLFFIAQVRSFISKKFFTTISMENLFTLHHKLNDHILFCPEYINIL